MRTTDRVLLGIVLGVVLLAGSAFALILLKPEPTYLGEDTPEAVVHNYLLALQREEYSRAHSYLSPNLPGYPRTEEQFRQQVEDSYLIQGINEGSLRTATATVRGTQAEVEVRETVFYDGSLFDSGQYVNTFTVELTQVGAGWKIADSERYFYYCWRTFGEC